MDRQRAAYAVMAILAVVCVALVASVAFPLSTADPTGSDQRFRVGDADSYRVAGNITTDGNLSLGVVGVVADSGARYERVADTVVTEAYQNTSRAGIVYQRTVADGTQAERLLADRRDDPDTEVVNASWDGDRLTMLAVDRSNDTTLDPTGAASVVANSLRLAQYEMVQAQPGLETRQPQPDWYEGQRPYRLTDVDGNVTLDADTRVLQDAHVEWTLTEGTGTYLHYLLARGSAVGQTYDYSYEPGDVAVEPPAWVTRLREET